MSRCVTRSEYFHPLVFHLEEALPLSDVIQHFLFDGKSFFLQCKLITEKKLWFVWVYFAGFIEVN
jgi:hypothetical protein